MNDPYNLERFVAAQSHNYEVAHSEIHAGQKRTHWMWYIFPQIAGLGHSAIAQHYAISSLEEARAYLAHPLLGARVRECVAALQTVKGTSAIAVFGPVDAMKLRSSLTLFAAVGTDSLFDRAIHDWFEGKEDEQTTEIIRNTARR